MNSKQIRIAARAFACASMLGLVAAAGCGGDDDSGGSAGSSGFGGFPAAGLGGRSGSGGAGAGGAGIGSGTAGTAGASTAGRGGTAGMMPMDAGTRCTGDGDCASGQACCDNMCTDVQADRENCSGCGIACDDTEICEDADCVPAMCVGDPGAPVNPDEDAGVDDDAGVDGPVFDDNGCPPNEACVIDGSDLVCQCGSGAGCAPDEQCNADGECRCGTGPECADDEACCGNDCIDIQTDEDNCGECGEVCAQGASCVAGECQCDDSSRIDCNGVCVEVDTNQNCRSCGNTCEAGTTCRDPLGDLPRGCYCPNVNEVPCHGVCVALGTLSNCGACDDACSAPATVCRNRACSCPTVGQTACDDRCVNLNNGIDTDASGNTLIEDCGACGVTCLANAACTNGECACPSASTIDKYCDENPSTGVTDGVFACIEVNTTKNCGDCGNACLDDSDCVESGGGNSPDDFNCVCMGAYQGLDHCRGVGCVDLDTNERACGECGFRCPTGVSCINGECDCPGNNLTACRVGTRRATCIDTNTDPNNCGGCGTVCAGNEVCCNGDCLNPATDFDNDRDNCGACGNQCPDTGCGLFSPECQCNNGVCET